MYREMDEIIYIILLDSKEINQSILKEINPEYSLEGLMLKMKLQHFGHLMLNSWLIGKDPDTGKDWVLVGMAVVGWPLFMELSILATLRSGEHYVTANCPNVTGYLSL